MLYTVHARPAMQCDAPTNTAKLRCQADAEPSLLQEAIAARDQTNGYKLDRSHTFAVTLFDDFERYARVPDEYQEPEAKPYQPTVRPVDTSQVPISPLCCAEVRHGSARRLRVSAVQCCG